MKIQSKYKDYYDYLQGIYGIDDKLFLDRSKGSVMSKMEIDNLEDGNKVNLAIMGLMFTMIYYQGKWYTERGLYNIGKVLGYKKVKKGKNYWRSDQLIKDVEIDVKTGLPKEYKNDNEIDPTDINDVNDCPILKVRHHNLGGADPFPRLADYNFGSVISPEEMWVNLYNWLSRIKEEPNIQTDKEKIVSHGFSLKTSFRNM